MYFRENWLSPRQNITNRCHILIAETTGNLLVYVLDCTCTKEKWVGKYIKAKTIRQKFLTSIFLYEKVLSIPLCCTGQMTCLTVIIKVTLTHWSSKTDVVQIRSMSNSATFLSFHLQLQGTPMAEEKTWNVCLIQHTAAFHISKDFMQYFISQKHREEWPALVTLKGITIF